MFVGKVYIGRCCIIHCIKEHKGKICQRQIFPPKGRSFGV